MIQLNNKQFRQTGGYSQGFRIPSVSSAPGASILKDDTMKNTKGNWYTYSYHDLDGIERHGVSSSNGKYIGEEMTEGDANLIALAPEMLQIVKEIVQHVEGNGLDKMPKEEACAEYFTCTLYYHFAKDLITKAGGK